MAEVNLEMLQVMLQAVLDGQSRTEAIDRVIDELGDLKPRTTNTEDALAGVNRRLRLAHGASLLNARSALSCWRMLSTWARRRAKVMVVM